MEISAVDDAYKRIERWIEMTKERDELTENALQTAFLLNVFRDALKWIRFTAMPEMRVKKKGRVDILLKPNARAPSTWVVVELKRPTVELSTSAIIQAAEYAAELKSTRCIVTNGLDWRFLDLKPTRKTAKRKFDVRVMFGINLERGVKKTERKALILALEQCRRSSIITFFNMLTDMRELGEPKISQLTKGKPRSAYPGIIAAAIEKATGQSPSKDNLKPLVTLCNGLGLFSRCTIQSYENHTISLPRKKISNNKS